MLESVLPPMLDLHLDLVEVQYGSEKNKRGEALIVGSQLTSEFRIKGQLHVPVTLFLPKDSN